MRYIMTESTSHTALITGGSRGLGLALARGLAQLRWNLIIDARGAEALNAARDELARLTSVIAIAGDVGVGGGVCKMTRDAGVGGYEGGGGYGSSKAALEQLSHILAAENPSWRVYWVDPGDMRTQMHQEAFPGEDISDRPLPEVSVPGLLALISGTHPSGRYSARALSPGEAQ